MRIEHDLKPMKELRTRAAELLRSVAESRRPVIITEGGEPRGVLMDVASYQELRKATLLLRLLTQGEADARAGRVAPQRRVFSETRSRVRQK
jgi:prevent-host-death family protein